MTITVEGGGGLALAFEPRRGAKVTSLIGAGVEWLAQGDARAAPERDALFTQAEMAGWDECAPSIVACTMGEYAIPDHGDLWDAEFSASGSRVSAIGRSYPYVFEREISATSSGFRFDYRATTTENVPFLWAAHPQFRAPAGTRVRIDGLEAAWDVQTRPAESVAWDAAVSTIDTVPVGQSRKVYAPPERPVVGARLERPDGILELRWSSTCPYLGVWFDNGAFSREPVIALEPSTGFYDGLDEAVRRGRVAWISPTHPLEWWLEIDVHPAGVRPS